ncbi:MAG: hypothetical protein R2713_23030 [Ilumatobacteraceae bacterium]
MHETDVFLAAGGDTLYLAHWMRESGMADMLPALSVACGSGSVPGAW